LDLVELPKEDKRNGDAYGDRKTYHVGAQNIRDEGQVGTVTIHIISTP
jgi:hypothetical protein